MLDMAYNSQLELLRMPEYGRNVQQLVRHAQTIENREYRQAFCEEIINLIQQLYPQSKNVEDYRAKLWMHLFAIADYKLDVDTPNGITPTPEDTRLRPEHVGYPQTDMRFRHYGRNVQSLMRKAIEAEEGPIKEGLTQTVGAYMKLAFRTWNKEHYVTDEVIKNDLHALSKGELSLENEHRIEDLSAGSRANNGGKNYGRNNKQSNMPNNNRNSNSNNSRNSNSNNNRNNNNPMNRNKRK